MLSDDATKLSQLPESAMAAAGRPALRFEGRGRLDCLEERIVLLRWVQRVTCLYTLKHALENQAE